MYETSHSYMKLHGVLHDFIRFLHNNPNNGYYTFSQLPVSIQKSGLTLTLSSFCPNFEAKIVIGDSIAFHIFDFPAIAELPHLVLEFKNKTQTGTLDVKRARLLVSTSVALDGLQSDANMTAWTLTENKLNITKGTGNRNLATFFEMFERVLTF